MGTGVSAGLPVRAVARLSARGQCPPAQAGMQTGARAGAGCEAPKGGVQKVCRETGCPGALAGLEVVYFAGTISASSKRTLTRAVLVHMRSVAESLFLSTLTVPENCFHSSPTVPSAARSSSS